MEFDSYGAHCPAAVKMTPTNGRHSKAFHAWIQSGSSRHSRGGTLVGEGGNIAV